MQTITKNSLIAFYLEWLNNFLTIERMAEYYEMPIEDCKYLVDLGRKYHSSMEIEEAEYEEGSYGIGQPFIENDSKCIFLNEPK